MLMDVILLDAKLVRSSHGCRPRDQADWPILISKQADLAITDTPLISTDVYGVLRSHVLDDALGQVLKRTDQVSKEFPQPQDCLALGFLILNPAPLRSSW